MLIQAAFLDENVLGMAERANRDRCTIYLLKKTGVNINSINSTRTKIIIQSRPAWKLLDIAELKLYKDVFYFLVKRDIQVRYRQTVLGGLWAVLQPFATMVVFDLFFNKIGHMSSGDIPYPLFLYAALVPWTYFANSLGNASNSLVSNQAFISKVYFPRIAIPAVAILARLVDFVIAMSVLFGMMIYYRFTPNIQVLMMPVLVLMIMTVALGLGLWLSALNVQYRDVGYIVPFLTSLWMFITPVIYPMTKIPDRFKLVYALNPMSGIIEGFRVALLGTVKFPWLYLGISAFVGLSILLSGLFYFRHLERIFADVV